MALIKCPECGNKISDKSDECVHCGFPIGEIPTIVKRKCEYCGRINEGYENSCLGCGADLGAVKTYKKTRERIPFERKDNPNRRYCLECGKIIPVFEERCPSCYRSQQKKIQEDLLQERRNETPDVPELKRDKVVALLLCIFLGWCGAHKFYERKMTTGIIYLITFGVFGYGWLIDIVILALKPNPYYVEQKWH